MSQENVELAWHLADAWNRRDVKATIALWDPEGVWYPPLEGITEGRTYRGHAGVHQYFQDVTEFLSPESRVEYSDVRDLGDRVLALGRARFNFVSGVVLDQELGFLQTWRSGRCIELRAWMDHAAALKAAGLSE